MTGSESTKTRTIVSSRLISPLSCCRDFNSKAIRFKQSINASVSSERLQADLAVKALSGSPLGDGRRQTYEDTDNKKREFTGESRPGVESNEQGYRWETAGTWAEGKKLVITPSFESVSGMGTAPNVGWVEDESAQPKSFEEFVSKIKKKPHIRLTKYKVNPKTDDIIPESEQIVDPFAMSSGLTAEQRAKQLSQLRGDQQVKKLPGRSLSSIVPGGNLVARAAATFGVLRDENNKFRCPPGTPAANQFTDMMGSNCFGFSPSRFARFAARQAATMEASGQLAGFRNNAKNFFGFLYQDNFGVGEDSALARVSRSPWWDAMRGDMFDPPDWRRVNAPEELRVFKNANIRAQDDLARQDASMAALYDSLGIDLDDESRAFKALDALRKMHIDSEGEAGWDLRIINTSEGVGKDSGRLSPEEVEKYISARLESIPGWRNLSKEEQQRLTKADVERYYVTERAFMEGMLDKFMQDPAQMRFIGRLEYNFFSGDEAGSGIYGGKGAPLKGVIHFNPEVILSNQESMLPDLRPDERLAISAVGAITDAEAKTAVADFLVNSTHAARRMAGLVDGPRSFTRHIAFHEVAHSIQELAFIQKIESELADKGFIEVPLYKKGVVVGSKKVVAIEQLTGSDVMNIMSDVADDINLEAMNEALSRIEVVEHLAGSYPKEFRRGGEVWALEAAAELHALRAQGLIYGEDVDAALEWMDKVVDGRAAEDRAAGDLGFAEIEEADTYDMPDTGPAEDVDITPEVVEDIAAREAEEKRRILKEYKEVLPTMTEDEMFSEAAILASQRDAEMRKASEILSMMPDEPGEDADEIRESLRKASRDARARADFYEKLYDETKSAWRKKYGIGARDEAARFDEEIFSIREREGLLDPDEAARVARLAELDDLRKSASTMSDSKLTRTIADREIMLTTLEPGSPEMAKAAEEIDVLKDQYVKNKIDGGDTRTSRQIKKELDSDIKNIVSPPPRKAKKFKSSSEAKNHASKERARLSRKTSLNQRKAMAEIGDPEESEILAVFNPEAQVSVGRGINRRNARLKRLGLEIDPKSAEEGSLSDQVENILIPTMEAIDDSSILDPFEMESIIELDGDALKGKIIGKELDVEEFLHGKVLRTGLKKSPVPNDGKKNKKTGKRHHRMIISVREGDRGYFPAAGDDDQKFTAPPGKIRIVSRDKDGTIRAEISYQKDAVEVVDGLAHSIETNDGDKIWREGASRKVKSVADKYVNKRRADGFTGPGPRSDDNREIAATSESVVSEVIDAGGTFGEAPELDTDIGTDSARLSSGRDAFGPVQTRSDRKSTRDKKVSSNLREAKLALGGRGSKEFPEITRDEIDPEVARLILDTPDEKLIEKIEETSYRLHSGFDRRVRVRMRDEDLDDLSKTGKVRSSMSRGSDDDGMSRRARRLSGMSPEERGTRLSSGGVIDSPEALAARRQKEEEIATKAVDSFNKIIAIGKNVNDLDDAEIEKTFGGRVKRSVQKSISAKDSNLYEVDDIDTAIAMMMLGHHVSVKSEDIRLTEQAQKVFESKIKEEAEKLVETNHPKWIEFQNSFSSENPDVDTSLPEVQKRMKSEFIDGHQADLCALYDPTKNLMCSGHIGIDREKMPQTNGRTVGHRTLAIRMLKDGKAAGKWEAKRGVTAPSPIQDIYKTDIDTENAKRVKNGEQPMSESEVGAFIYKKIGKKHSLEAELSGKTSQDNRSAYESISPEEKDWFYESTNWQNVEVNLEKPFIDFLNGRIEVSDPENGSSVRLRKVNPAEYAPSQQQLVASKVDGMAQGIQEAAVKISRQIEESGIKRGTPEFKKAYEEEMAKQWFSSPILTTKDKFILDGHHRWAGIVVANRSLPEELRIELSANEVQTDIVEGLTLGKVFQEVWGIKEARLGAEIPWEQGDVTPIPDDEVAENSRRLIEQAPQMIDDLYERGDYIQIGSVGLTNNPDYAKAVSERRTQALTRRPSRLAQQREAELDAAISRAQGGAGRLSSGRLITNSRADVKAVNKVVKNRMKKMPIPESQKRAIQKALWDIHISNELYKDSEVSMQAFELSQNYGPEIANLFIGRLLGEKRIDVDTWTRAQKSITGEETLEWFEKRKLSMAFNRAYDVFMPEIERIQSSRTPSVDAEGLSENPRGAGRLGRLSRSSRTSFDSGRLSSGAVSPGKTVNSSNDELSREYFSRIGLPSGMSDESLPVSGYLVHKSHVEEKRNAVKANKSGSLLPGAVFEIGDSDPVGDGLTALGDIEVVLKPGVSNRTAYGRGNAIETGHRPVLLNSRNRSDVADALINTHGKNSKNTDMEAMMSVLSASIDGNLGKINAGRDDSGRLPATGAKISENPRTPFEAQILGGFDIDEVEQINYPFTRLNEESAGVKIDDVVNRKTIAERLRSAGFTQEEIEYFYSLGGEGINTQSMKMLKNYRKAQELKEAYAKKGFNNLKIAHPEGLDIERPTTHSKGARPTEKVEDVLKRNIAKEIIEQAEDLLKDMRKPSAPRTATRRGARL